MIHFACRYYVGPEPVVNGCYIPIECDAPIAYKYPVYVEYSLSAKAWYIGFHWPTKHLDPDILYSSALEAIQHWYSVREKIAAECPIYYELVIENNKWVKRKV